MLSQKGEEVKKQIKLDNSVFGADVNHALIRQALFVYLNNQRQSNAHTKTRGDVRGGGAKPWRQKGTGRARQGSTRSPIWAGGGVAFGPKSDKNYKRKLSKKMVKGAIRSAFSLVNQENRLYVMENPELKAEKLTNQVESIVRKLPVAGKLLIVHSGQNTQLYMGGRNIPGLRVIPVNEVNTYELIKNDFVVVTDDSLETISKFWGLGAKKEDAVEETKAVKETKTASAKVSSPKVNSPEASKKKAAPAKSKPAVKAKASSPKANSPKASKKSNIKKTN